MEPTGALPALPPHPTSPLSVVCFTATSAIGRGIAQTEIALRAQHSGLRRNDFGAAPVPSFIGRVAGIEAAPLPQPLARWECRNSRLAWLALLQDDFVDKVAAACARHGAHRVALALGTSTSSIGATEEAYRDLSSDGGFPEHLRRPEVHTPHSTTAFVQQALGLFGPCITVATACSSSAKVFAQAERLLRTDTADAVVVGGVDSLCDSVVYGFNALELLSPDPCRPFDCSRRGINIGEAAGFALLERGEDSELLLLGYGESSDAYHMSSPHPEGLGARVAVRDALARGATPAAAIDYINLHGTASQKNDEVEAKLVAGMFPARTHASSTKGWTGHTLGAAGILEAAITLVALHTGFMPGTLNCEQLDSACGPQIRLRESTSHVQRALSMSFGFGGSNCVLLFGRGGCA